MALLPINALPSSLFTYSAGTFVAEASDLGPAFNLQRIYDDACDEGLAIRSPSGRAPVRFYLDEVQRDADGDIQVWKFKPITEDARRAGCAALRVLIFND